LWDLAGAEGAGMMFDESLLPLVVPDGFHPRNQL
jgi:hypothetical protein